MTQNIIDPDTLAGTIDHTFLQADGSVDAIEKLCEEARAYRFAAVMVHPAEVERCRALMHGAESKVGTVAGFPLGQSSTTVKLFEIEDAISRGAQEVDMVINQRAVRSGDLTLLREEIFGLSELCRPKGVVSKVILECCNLTDDEKAIVCRMISEARCDFAKTSTGFGAHGATAHDVRLMKANLSAGASVKASGGIRTLSDALEMLAAGATRLGTSAGVTIIDEARSGRQATLGGTGY